MLHVVLVLAEAWDVTISESGNIFLTNGLKVSGAAKGTLLSTIAAAILTSAKVTKVKFKFVSYIQKTVSVISRYTKWIGSSFLLCCPDACLFQCELYHDIYLAFCRKLSFSTLCSKKNVLILDMKLHGHWSVQQGLKVDLY